MTLKKCIICGAEFEAKYKKNQTCSNKCRMKLYRAEHPWTGEKKTVTCIECGKDFETDNAKRKLCSENCKKKRVARLMNEHYKKINSDLPERVCPICGKSFVPPSVKTQTCSRSCAALLVARTRAEKAKECKECGKKFYTACGSKVYCCEKCRDAAEKRRKKEQEKTKKMAAETRRQKQSPASQRWAKMPLFELDKELLYYGIDYGESQVMAQNNTLPEDFGLKHKEARENDR